MDRPALLAEKASLERLLTAREGKSGYAENCREIRARLSVIAQALADE